VRFVADSAIAAQLARDDQHVAVLTVSAVAADLDRGALVALPVRGFPKWTVPLALAYRTSDAHNPAVEAVAAAALGSIRDRGHAWDDDPAGSASSAEVTRVGLADGRGPPRHDRAD
jgi:DNA-binding transcriptional LysR family regulator